MKILRSIIHLVIIALAVLYAVSCSFQVSADGAKSFAIDGEQAAKAIRILSEK